MYRTSLVFSYEATIIQIKLSVFVIPREANMIVPAVYPRERQGLWLLRFQVTQKSKVIFQINKHYCTIHLLAASVSLKSIGTPLQRSQINTCMMLHLIRQTDSV